MPPGTMDQSFRYEKDQGGKIEEKILQLFRPFIVSCDYIDVTGQCFAQMVRRIGKNRFNFFEKLLPALNDPVWNGFVRSHPPQQNRALHVESECSRSSHSS